jgi:D-serine deaminase-like pyridoxal phosphate-dependent protein
MQQSWFKIDNVDDVGSPALLVYPDRVEENIRRMIRIAGGVERLRPHIKTNKLPEVIRMQLDQGITKFKCATIAEAEMAAACLAPDVLLAYQPVGPNVQRCLQLMRAFPRTRFSVLVDDAGTIRALANAAVEAGRTVDVFLDLDCGMHRTGVPPGPAAVELYRLVAGLPGLNAAGLHAYDGHIRDTDPAARTAACDAAFAPVRAMRTEAVSAGLPVPTLIAGGTPTFPVWAKLDKKLHDLNRVSWAQEEFARLRDAASSRHGAVQAGDRHRPGACAL